MITKQIGDIAEMAVALEAMRLGFGVSKPLGDWLPYDLIFDTSGCLYKIQVKSAYRNRDRGFFSVKTIRSNTNRKVCKKTKYREGDFDFLIAYIPGKDVYVMPFSFLKTVGQTIQIGKEEKSQRDQKSRIFKNAWHLIGRTDGARVAPDAHNVKNSGVQLPPVQPASDPDKRPISAFTGKPSNLALD